MLVPWQSQNAMSHPDRAYVKGRPIVRSSLQVPEHLSAIKIKHTRELTYILTEPLDTFTYMKMINFRELEKVTVQTESKL